MAANDRAVRGAPIPSFPLRGKGRIPWLLAACLAAAFALIAGCGGESAERAPDFEIALFGDETHAEGELLSLSSVDGSPLVMNFWFPSCAPCRAEMPDLEASYQKHRDRGVIFLGVTNTRLNTVQEAKEFIAEVGVTYPVGADDDGAIVRAFGVSNFPSTVFIDADQNLVRKWAGLLDAEKLDEIIGEMLGDSGALTPKRERGDDADAG